jgi:hypothetical protein
LTAPASAKTAQIYAKSPEPIQNYAKPDLDKLAYCVAWHETHNGALGVGKTHNNAFGIRRNGRFVRYSSIEESYADFKQLWAEHYGGLPNIEKARRYSGRDRSATWLKNVNSCLYK